MHFRLWTLSALCVAPLLVAATGTPQQPKEVRVTVPAAPQAPAPVPNPDAIAPNYIEGLTLDPATPGLTAEERTRRRELTAAMHEELSALRQTTRTEVARLSEAVAKAATPHDMLELEAQAAALKDHEVRESLVIQARYAAEVGNRELVAEIEQAIDRFDNPAPAPAAPEAVRPRTERATRGGSR